MTTYEWKSLVNASDKDRGKKTDTYDFHGRKFQNALDSQNYLYFGLGVRPERLYQSYTTAHIICYAVDNGGNKYYKFIWPVTGLDKHYYSFDFGYKVSYSEIEEQNSLGSLSVVVPMISSSTFTLNGAWTDHPNVFVYGNHYYESIVPEPTVSFTTPVSNATRLAIRCVIGGNGGFAKVVIDGDASKANLCSTAWELVKSGVMGSDALTENGGFFERGDRVINYWGSLNYAGVIMLADNLPAETHTIVVTSSGAKPPNSSSSVGRTYVTGFAYGNSSTAMGDAGALIDGFGAVKYIVKGSDSVVEYAALCRPTAGGTTMWVGNGHGNDTQTSLTINVDGVVLALTAGESASGATIIVTRNSNLTHPDYAGGTGTFCEVVQKYTLSGIGILLERTETWKTGVTFSDHYVGMCPCEGYFSMGAAATSPAQWVSLTANDSGLYCRERSDLIYAYEPGGNYALALSMGAGTSYTTSTGAWDTFIQDRTASLGYVHKLYAIGDTTSVVADQVLTWANRIIPVYYEDGL